MTALILAAVLAQADGGIYSLCPERAPVVEMDGGILVSDQQGRRLNCIMDACDFRVKELEKTLAEPPPPYKVIVAVVVALAAGAVAGFICAKTDCLPF